MVLTYGVLTTRGTSMPSRAQPLGQAVQEAGRLLRPLSFKACSSTVSSDSSHFSSSVCSGSGSTCRSGGEYFCSFLGTFTLSLRD